MANLNTERRRRPSQHIVQNFHLVWLDGSISEDDDDDNRNFLIPVRQVVNTINTFSNADECLDFVNNIQEKTTFMIFSGAIGERNISIFHDKKQISAIYIFCGNKARHETWAKQWSKINGIFTDIQSICQALKQATHDCDHNTISFSFATTNKNTLDCSFMYTQILKDILFTIDFNHKHINDFLKYCRIELVGNRIELKNVDRIEQEYHDHQPIWWYTCETFLYSMLNRALRSMDVDIIIQMAFFLCDLHKNIANLHSNQFHGQTSSNSFIVYRGQSLSPNDFNQLKQNHGGLLAFNNFLSTSKNRNISLQFLHCTLNKKELMPVLFVMHIDPSIKSTPFADVDTISALGGEEEILFSMHSVFRIGQIKQIPESTSIWQVELTLTGDNDPELRELTESIQKKTSSNYTGWHSLGKLLIELAKFDKAEELYRILLKQTADQTEEAYIFNQLGFVNDHQGNFTKALEFYEKSLEIYRQTLPANHSDFANSYNNIGMVYDNTGEYSKALKYYEKSLEIYKITLPANHSSLATAYNNIGNVYDSMKEYSKALKYYENSLEIKKQILPANHPSLATAYNNIGLLYNNTGEYSKALEYYENSLEIKKKTLPANHPSLGTSYNNIGNVYDNMGEYSKALEYYEKDLEISKKSLPANHPDLVTAYNNIAWTYRNMTDHKKALEYYEHALDILPVNHRDVKVVKKNIEAVKKKL